MLAKERRRKGNNLFFLIEMVQMVSAHQSLLYFYLPRDPENIQV